MSEPKNISGNFDTKNEEVESVRDFMNQLKIPTNSIEKFGQDKNGKDTNAKSAADILVKCFDKTELLFEVKEEYIKRIEKHNQLGIDFISVFQFKKGMGKSGIYRPSEYQDFIKAIDFNNKNFKWGKIAYSKSDIWLFYCKKDGKYVFLDGYDFRKMQQENFFQRMMLSCDFAVNNKSKDQMSSTDSWLSAVFYVDRDMMERYRIRDVHDLYSTGNFTSMAMLNGRVPSVYDFTILTRSKDRGKPISEASADSLNWILSEAGQSSGCDKIPEIDLIRDYVASKTVSKAS